MKIKTLDIYGYGKWVNQSFDIHSDLQLFYGKNESGKSTIQSFIRSILFGFPDKRKRKVKQNRYEPKQADAYGGRILLEDGELGQVWIERTANSLKVTDSTGQDLGQAGLDKILGGIDGSLYDTFYAFNLENLQTLAGVGSDQLSDYFLSVGTLGSDKFLRLSKNLDKEARNLFKSRGSNPPLNTLLEEYDELAQHLDDKQAQMSRYNNLVKQEQEEIKTIKEIESKIASLDDQLKASDQMLTRYDIFLKDKAAERELDRLTYTEIDREAPGKLDQKKQQIQQNQLQLAQLQERLKHVQGQLQEETRLLWARNHKEERREWYQATQSIKDTQAHLEQMAHLLQENEASMEQLARRNQFYPDKIEDSQSYQLKLENGIGIQADKDDLEGRIDQIRYERKVYLNQRKDQQNYSAIVRQQMAKLENQRMNEEELLIQETSLKDYFFGGLFFIIGLSIVGYCLMAHLSLTSLYFILGSLITLLGSGLCVYTFLNHRRKFQAFQESPILMKLDELKGQEKQYRQRSQELGLEINEREEILESYLDDLDQIMVQQRRWLTDLGFYPTADPDLVLKANPVKDYFQMQAKCQDYRAALDEDQDKVDAWRTSLDSLLDRFSLPVNDPTTRQLIRFVEETEASLKEAEGRGERLDQLLEDIQANMSALDQKNQTLKQETQTILKASHSQSEDDFKDKVKVNDRIEKLRQERDLHATYIQGHESGLEAIESKQALLDHHQDLQRQLKLHKDQVSPHQHQRANLAVEIKLLQEDGSFQEIQQKLVNKESQIRAVLEEWGRKQLAMAMIEQTLSQGLDDPLPEMIAIASDIFASLTFGRYSQIKANKNSLKVKHNSDVLFAPHELSQGTLEQLYVAIRLAFILSAENLVQMPIIIDDAFVNFDEVRKTSMNQVLEKVSEKIQILYFTFDQQTIDSFNQEQIISLESVDKNVDRKD